MKRSADAGFSLVEMLVVIAIVGVMSSLTVMSIAGVDRGAQPEAEAKLFASRIALAMDEALLTGKPLILVLDQQGYVVDVAARAGQEPEPYPDAQLGVRHEVSGGLRVDGQSQSRRVTLMPDGTGDPFNVVFPGVNAWRVTADGLSARAEPLGP